MQCISLTRETEQRRYNIAYIEGAGYTHNGREHKHVLHKRQCNEPELLPAVMNAVDSGRLVIGAVNALETCYKCKE